MLIFNTRSQARNYVKHRAGDYNHHEGCGCCYWGQHTFIKGNRVLQERFHSHVGDQSSEFTVIGRIKKKKGAD